MSGKKKGGDGGGHGAAWVVTFSDLMALLMAFFVMIVSFSTQDSQKVAQAAGSIKDAFGVQPLERPAGMIEVDGNPVRHFLKQIGSLENAADTEFANDRNDQASAQGPEADTHQFEKAGKTRPRQYLSAAVAIRQALASEPDIAQLSHQVLIEETDEGLNLRLVDEVGQSMFDASSARPNPPLEQILEHIAPILAQLPNRIRISGHTSSDRRTEPSGAAAWSLSTQRALATASILSRTGLPGDHLESVVGKADTEPLFPNDPFLSANRRIDILLLHEAPPVPINMQH